MTNESEPAQSLNAGGVFAASISDLVRARCIAAHDPRLWWAGFFSHFAGFAAGQLGVESAQTILRHIADQLKTLPPAAHMQPQPRKPQ